MKKWVVLAILGILGFLIWEAIFAKHPLLDSEKVRRRTRRMWILLQGSLDDHLPRLFSMKNRDRKASARPKSEVTRSGLSGKPRLWREPRTGMVFVWVPAGCFRMGSDRREKNRKGNEGPAHEVCLDGFWMGQTEVTRSQFRRFIEATGYVTDAEKQGYSWVYTHRWERKPGYSWRRAGFAQEGNHPVVNVSWSDAEAMARWLTSTGSGSFRLPTEAEWEYACRAGTLKARFWGDSPAKACRYANIADRSAADQFPVWTVHPCTDGFVFTAPVAHFKPNPFGLYDMIGNVWEWCEDVYRPDAYRQHAHEDPLVKSGGSGHVVRGGSWYSRPEIARCARRDYLSHSDRRSQDQGFRLVRK